jgi:hypothetical protein
MDFDIIKYLNSLPVNTKEINVSSKALTNLDITRFTNLEILICSENRLTSLNVNMNTKLKELYCSNNHLTSLHLNKNLEILYCYNNQLTSLHLNENLQELYCSENQLTSLLLNEKLEILYCDHNHLSSLYLNENVRTFYYSDNPIFETTKHINKKTINGKQKLKILNNFRFLYYSLKFKSRFRYWLWERIREPKIQEKYHPRYLIENLYKDTDLDTVLDNWVIQ